MKYWRAISPQTKTLTYELICVKYNFYPATTKNDNRAVLTRKLWFNTNGRNNYTNLKEGQHRGIEDLLNCSTTFLFFSISVKLKVFRVTQNETSKMAKFSVSANRMSRFFMVHAVEPSPGHSVLYQTPEVDTSKNIIYDREMTY